MEKLKNWFSVENNVNLIRDFLFVFALFAALLLGVYMSIPRVHAAEVSEITSVQLPELPAYTDEDPYQDEYVDHQLVVYANGSYYAVLYSTFPDLDEVCIYKHGQVTNGRSSIYFGTLTQLRQIDVYQLVDDTWSTVLNYPLPGNNGTTTSAFGIYFTSAEYSDAVTNQTMLVYSDIPVAASLDGSVHSLTSGNYNVIFGDGHDAVASLALNVGTLSSGLFDVAKDAVQFITDNPICLVGILLFVIFAGTGIAKTYTKGV